MLSTSIRKNSFVQDYEITMIRKIKLFDLLRERWTAFLANSGRLRMDDRNLGRQFIIICEFQYKHFVEKICVIEFFLNIVFFCKMTNCDCLNGGRCIWRVGRLICRCPYEFSGRASIFRIFQKKWWKDLTSVCLILP